MSFADEGEFLSFIGRDELLPKVTPIAVGDALLTFPHDTAPGVTLGWLAMAVRRSLAFTIPNASEGPGRKENAEIRRELEALADTVQSAWVKVFERSSEADGQVWDHAFRNWEGANALAARDDPAFDYSRFQRALGHMDWLASLLRQAARETEKQMGPWRSSEEKRLRTMRGHVLAPIFEVAFGQPATANNWPSGKEVGKTPFMEFYQRMVELAFDETSTPNISGVLKDACKLHRQDPVEWVEGIIPKPTGA